LGYKHRSAMMQEWPTMSKFTGGALALFAVTPFVVLVACGGAGESSNETAQASSAVQTECTPLLQSTGIHPRCITQGGGGGGGSAPITKPTPTAAPTATTPPVSSEVQGCVEGPASWAMATPQCTAADAGGESGLGYDTTELCDSQWALWSQLQSAGCTTPRQVANSPAWGEYYSWCPPGSYGDPNGPQPPTLNYDPTAPNMCPVAASTIAANTQLVLWFPKVQINSPFGCDIEICYTQGPTEPVTQ
jgi:hypothetical protein